MSISTKNHSQPIWLRIKMISHSRAHRAMRKFGHLKLNSHVCPQVDEKFEEFKQGKITVGQLRAWLGQVHTDYVSALDQTQEQLIKTRIRLRATERKLHKQQETPMGKLTIDEGQQIKNLELRFSPTGNIEDSHWVPFGAIEVGGWPIDSEIGGDEKFLGQVRLEFDDKTRLVFHLKTAECTAKDEPPRVGNRVELPESVSEHFLVLTGVVKDVGKDTAGKPQYNIELDDGKQCTAYADEFTVTSFEEGHDKP